MNLYELFRDYPIHGRTELVISCHDGKEKTIDFCEYVDGALPDVYAPYDVLNVIDIIPVWKNEIATLKIVVKSRESLVKTTDGWYYHSDAGNTYELAELGVPASGKKWDLGVILVTNHGDNRVLDYVWGLADMTDDEVIRFCRDAVKGHERGVRK